MNEILNAFPDDYGTNEEKNSDKFGKEVCKAISGTWYGGLLSERRSWIDEMRSYGKGEQQTDYQTMIEGKRKNSKYGIRTHKIDYTKKLKTLKLFRDIVTNSIDESLFKPRAEAINKIAVNLKKDYFNKLDNDFYTKDIAMAISKGTGIDITNPNIPENEKQLQVRKLEYKPDIEIAQELAIENVFKHQMFENIKDKIDEDLFDLGFAVGRHYTDNLEGIKTEYIDPKNYLHSNFEMEDGRDIRFHGVIKQDTIGNLARKAGGLSEDELLLLKKKAMQSDKVDAYRQDEDENRLVEYIHVEYLVPVSDVFKKLRKNKSVKLIDRSLTGYNPTNENKKIEIPYNIWYEGVYVPDADVLIKWEKLENQIEDNLNNPVSSYVVYAPKIKRISETKGSRFDSMVERAIPILDDMQRDWYKFQQLKMELRPNTTELDVDALQNVTLNGEKLDPKTILDLFFGRGLLLKQKYDEDGDIIEDAIKEKGSNVNYQALQFLSNQFAENYNKLRQLIGVNELRDGTTQANSRMSATVQKLLLASSNNATNHIVKASFNMSLMFAKGVSYRLRDVMQNPELKDMYMDIIGTNNVELLYAIKDIPIHRFGIYFDFKPDNEERLAFEQSLINSLQAGEINSSQYNKARTIRNVKNAIRYLEIVIEENIEKKEALKIKNIEAQAQANAKSTVIAEKTKQQTAIQEWNIKKQEMLLKAKLEREAKRSEALTKDILAERQHRRNKEIEQIKVDASMNLNVYKEGKKDDRINQTSTNTSAIADQKKNNKGPIDFQNQIDSIFNSSENIDTGPSLATQLDNSEDDLNIEIPNI